MAKQTIVFAGLMPHAPILIPGVAGQRLAEVRRTVDALRTLARQMLAARPDTLVLISPHSPRRPNAYGLWRTERLHGSFRTFGAPDDPVDLPLDSRMADAIAAAARPQGLRTWPIQEAELDHGALVPLWYLAQAGWQGPTVILSLSQHHDMNLAQLGKAIATATIQLGRRTALIASGDMSHRLTPSAPCGFHPTAHSFDETFIDLVRQGRYADIGRIDANLQENAAEDVVASTLIATAAVGGSSQGHRVLSYEGPFGVGYGVAVLFAAATDAANAPAGYAHHAELPCLARRAIQAYWESDTAHPPLPIGGELAKPGCVFVTLHDARGELRGCIGTLRPSEPNLGLETWRNARAAAFHDPRFTPLSPAELPGLRLSVTVLGTLESIPSPRELDPARYGVVIRAADGRRGVLLPGIDDVETVAQQLAITRHKAGIGPDEAIELQRFTVQCFKEAPPTG